MISTLRFAFSLFSHSIVTTFSSSFLPLLLLPSPLLPPLSPHLPTCASSPLFLSLLHPQHGENPLCRQVALSPANLVKGCLYLVCALLFYQLPPYLIALLLLLLVVVVEPGTAVGKCLGGRMGASFIDSACKWLCSSITQA